MTHHLYDQANSEGFSYLSISLSPIRLMAFRALSSCFLVCEADMQNRALEVNSDVAGKPTTTTAICTKEQKHEPFTLFLAKEQRMQEYFFFETQPRKAYYLGRMI